MMLIHRLKTSKTWRGVPLSKFFPLQLCNSSICRSNSILRWKLSSAGTQPIRLYSGHDYLTDKHETEIYNPKMISFSCLSLSAKLNVEIKSACCMVVRFDTRVTCSSVSWRIWSLCWCKQIFSVNLFVWRTLNFYQWNIYLPVAFIANSVFLFHMHYFHWPQTMSLDYLFRFPSLKGRSSHIHTGWCHSASSVSFYLGDVKMVILMKNLQCYPKKNLKFRVQRKFFEELVVGV